MPDKLPADAIMMDESKKTGSTSWGRIDSLCSIAEPLLGLDKAKGQTAWIRRQPGGKVFVTGSPTDTIYYPNDHDKAGQPRYGWVVSTADPGIELGYLLDKAAPEPTPEPAPADAVITPVPLDGTGGLGVPGNA